MDAKLDVEAETETEILAVVSCKTFFKLLLFLYTSHMYECML